LRPQKRINPPGANGTRMTGEDRRLQILRVAMRLFSQRGFRGTTTKEIALAAGVSEAMVFRHFATKEELYSAILDHKACVHESMDPLQVVAQAVAAKDDRAVFEGLALDALNQHDCDPEFHRLLLHSALEEHELAQMFWEKFVKRVYRTLRGYIRERQREGAMRDVEPLIVVRAFIGMIIHHSLNNNLWDRKQQLLKISNKAAAREFTDILLHGVAMTPQVRRSTNRRDATKRDSGPTLKKGSGRITEPSVMAGPLPRSARKAQPKTNQRRRQSNK
jgi:AcrR family transcriptional regulator